MIHMIETVHRMEPKYSLEDLNQRFVETFKYGVSSIGDYAQGGRYFYLQKPANQHLTPEKMPYGTAYAGDAMPIYDGTNSERWLAGYFNVVEKDGKVRLKLRTNLPEFFDRQDPCVWLRAAQVTQAMRIRWSMIRQLMGLPKTGGRSCVHHWGQMELCWQTRCDSPSLRVIGDILAQQDPGGLGWQSVLHHFGRSDKRGVYRRVYAKGLERVNRGRGRGRSTKVAEEGTSDLLRCEVSLDATDAQQKLMWKILHPVTGDLDCKEWYDIYRKYMPHQVCMPGARITFTDRKRIMETYSIAEGLAICAILNDQQELASVLSLATESSKKYGKFLRHLRNEMNHCQYDGGVISLGPPDDYGLFLRLCDAGGESIDKRAPVDAIQAVPEELRAELEEILLLLTV